MKLGRLKVFMATPREAGFELLDGALVSLPQAWVSVNSRQK
jgi:hypothetical protein